MMRRAIEFKWMRTLLRLCLLCALLPALAACERIQPVRTLPNWVRGVYVPMIKNQSYTAGYEEEATRLTQETFLNDGRLDVVPKKDADLTVKIQILEWRDKTNGSGGDHIADQIETTLVASVQLFDPHDDSAPLADLGKLRITSGAYVDIRSTFYEQEPDRREDLLKRLAREIVDKTIEGFPANLRNLPAGQALPTVPTSTNDVHGSDVLKERQSEDR